MSMKRKLLIGPLIILLALSAVLTALGASEDKAKEEDTRDAIVMDVTYGYDNRAKGGRYVPLDVSLGNNRQQPFEGTLQVMAMESDYEVYRYDYPVEIEAGKDLEMHLYIPMGNRSEQLFVAVVDA